MAQVFELHFNPKLKEDLIFDSFCYEPEDVYEKRLGSLYMVGELKNALPQNARFLDNLAQVIKGKFYAFPVQSVEKGLKESLSGANEFLEKEVEQDNTRWLGNLNFAVISLEKFNLNFTKVGDIKILLLRGGQIIDIGKELEFQEIEPYPLKIFSNIVSGKLSSEDIIFVTTKDVFSTFAESSDKKLFSSGSLLNEIAKAIPFDEKRLKKILRQKEKELSEISGISLLIVLKPQVLQKLALSFEKEVPLFPIREVFKPVTIKIKNLFKILKRLLPAKPSIKIPLPSKKAFPLRKLLLFGEKIKIFPNLIWQQFSKKINLFQRIKSSPKFKKKIILVSTLIFFLLAGFFIFKERKKALLKEAPEILLKIQDKINMAENFLILKEEEKANSMFQEAWEEILPLTKIEHPLKDEALALKESIEEELLTLNKIKIIPEPTVLLEFSKQEFLPLKMIELDKVLYFFNPYSKGLYKFERGEKIKIEIEQKFNKALLLNKSSILFFSEPDELVFWKEDRIGTTITLKLPFPDFVCTDFSSFLKNIYLLDGKKGEIIKYASPIVIGKDFPQYWLDSETKKPIGGKSMAIDGLIWILNSNNGIDRYYLGKHQETLILDFFPPPKNLEKILINQNLPYLFLLEPEQNRIIVLEKSGQVVSQFQSEKFDDLKDFAVSTDGIIYLLNGQKIYQMKLK